MDITYARLVNTINAANSYFQLADKAESKFKYALRRFIKANQEHIDRYNDLTLDFRLEWASVDDKKNLIMQGDNYSYTKENYKKLNNALKELQTTEITIIPFLIAAKDEPTDILPAHRIVFEGLIIPALPEQEG